MSGLVSTFLAVSAVSALAAPPIIPQYTDETTTAGVHSQYTGEWQYMVGGGAAVFDCNGDGYPDMLLAGGQGKSAFYLNRSHQGGPLRFAKRRSGLEFSHVTGAYPLDVDGDGIMDVVILRVGENKVMRGTGHCQFVEANKDWHFGGGDGWSTAFSAIWEKGMNWPSLAIGNYIDRTKETDPWGSCTDNYLYRPSTDQKSFTSPLALKPSFCALSMLFTDWNHTGHPSLRISNDREYYEGGQEQLWKMPAVAPPQLTTEAEGWKYLRIWGMGIATADLDFDGYPEYFLTSMADSKLQTLEAIPTDSSPKPGYKDLAYSKGVTAHRPFLGTDLRPSTGWHAEFADVNNDGRMDLFIAKGNVAEMKDFAMKDPNNLLLQQPDGKFVEAANQAGVASTETSRGGAVVDFNLDGKLDLLVVNRKHDAQIWRNTSSNLGHWVEIKPQANASNRQAIGGAVEIKRGDKIERRELFSGAGHASGQLGWWHIGLGEMTSVELRVIWPDGDEGPWSTLTADAFYILPKGQQPQPWVPKR